MDDYDGNPYDGTDTNDRDFWSDGDEPRGSIDWTRCPLCGNAEGFAIQTDERIYGSSHIDVEVGPDSQFASANSRDTEIAWNTAKVIGYFASCCLLSLPEEYQQALDQALGKQRVNT